MVIAYASADDCFLPRIEKTIAPWAELSGIAYDPKRNAFVVVGDEGDIFVISREGEILEMHAIAGADLEDVALDVEGRKLYVLNEKIPEILVLDADDLRQTGRIDLSGTTVEFMRFRERAVGFEGLAFIRKGILGDAHRLVVSNQVRRNGKHLNESSGFLIMNTDGQSARFIVSGIRDCASLTVDPEGDGLWALLDTDNEIIHISFTGIALERFHTDGIEQEGIAWVEKEIAIVGEDGTFMIGELRREKHVGRQAGVIKH